MNKQFKRTLVNMGVIVAMAAMAAGCGGGGGDGGGGAPTVEKPAAPTPTMSYGIKQLQFSWPAVTGATYYKLLENADGKSGYPAVPGADNINALSVNHEIALYQRVNASYIVTALQHRWLY